MIKTKNDCYKNNNTLNYLQKKKEEKYKHYTQNCNELIINTITDPKSLVINLSRLNITLKIVK